MHDGQIGTLSIARSSTDAHRNMRFRARVARDIPQILVQALHLAKVPDLDVAVRERFVVFLARQPRPGRRMQRLAADALVSVPDLCAPPPPCRGESALCSTRAHTLSTRSGDGSPRQPARRRTRTVAWHSSLQKKSSSFPPLWKHLLQRLVASTPQTTQLCVSSPRLLIARSSKAALFVRGGGKGEGEDAGKLRTTADGLRVVCARRRVLDLYRALEQSPVRRRDVVKEGKRKQCFRRCASLNRLL